MVDIIKLMGPIGVIIRIAPEGISHCRKAVNALRLGEPTDAAEYKVDDAGDGPIHGTGPGCSLISTDVHA